MTCSQFLDQVQSLMHAQQLKNSEIILSRANAKSNYTWLAQKRCVLTYMSARDEFLVRQALLKVGQDERVKVMRQLLSWVDEHPLAQAQKVPEMCVLLLARLHTLNLLSGVALSRQSTFRSSLRRLSFMSNRVGPEVVVEKSVKFDGRAKVYCISD